MGRRETDTEDDQPEYRSPAGVASGVDPGRTTRAVMPDWAVARKDSTPDPQLREFLEQLWVKYFSELEK
jgi:hypothetical protein